MIGLTRQPVELNAGRSRQGAGWPRHGVDEHHPIGGLCGRRAGGEVDAIRADAGAAVRGRHRQREPRRRLGGNGSTTARKGPLVSRSTTMTGRPAMTAAWLPGLLRFVAPGKVSV